MLNNLRNDLGLKNDVQIALFGVISKEPSQGR